MTGRLVAVAFDAARAGPLPVPPAERLLAIERVAARPRQGGAGIRPPVSNVRWRWGDDLAAGLAERSPATDRAIVVAFLRHWPGPAFAQGAAMAASRSCRDWAARGERHRLWQPDGPATLAAALLATDPLETLGDAGLAGDLTEGAFVGHAIVLACRATAALHGGAAIAAGERLIALFAGRRLRTLDPLLARALLAPWLATDPPRGHGRAVVRCLIARLGEPGRAAARWMWATRPIPGAAATIERWR